MEANQVRILETLERPNETKSATTSAVTEAMLSSARDIASIQSATNHQIRGDPAKNIVYCGTCVAELTEQVTKMSRVDGVFHFDFSLGTGFSKSEKMPKAFTNLKILIKQHMSSKGHKRHVEQATKKAAASTERKADSKSVAIRVLREAFNVLKFSLAHVHFEVNIVSHHRNSVNMGDIGHSAAQMSRFRDAFWAETMDGVKRFIAQQPCVSLIADKATINHRTVDITAVLCVVPEAPLKDLVQSFVIAAPVVKDHGGLAIAEEWHRSLSKVGVTRSDQLASVCTDGQYHSIGAPRKLIDLMKRSQQDLREQSRPAAVPVMWDSAHLVELAESSARKEPLCSWVEEVKNDISRISQRFTMASGWEPLHSAGAELQMKTLRPRSWSDTRFAPYAAAVIDAFINNITAMRSALDGQLTSPETKTSLRADLEKDLQLLEDPQFNIRLAALQDSVIGECSRAMQNVQLLPWERQEACQQLVKTLAVQKGVLIVICRLPQQRQKSLTPSEIHGHLLEPDPEDMSKWWPTLGKQAATIRPKQAAEISVFVGALHEHFQKRERGVDARGNTRGCQNASLNTWMQDIRTVGDLERLAASPTSSIADDVQTAIARLRQGGCIPTSTDVPTLSIVMAYRVVRELRVSKGVTDNRVLFKALYHQTQSQPELKPLVNTIIRLWLTWPLESVVESMASVISDVFGTRRQLSHHNAAKELIVRWNSPDVFAADELIQAVQDKHRFEFVRRTNDIRSAFEGTVIGRHLRPDQPDRRASVFRRHKSATR